MVNERDDLKDSLKNERDVCDRNRPAEVARNFPHEQLQDDRHEHDQDDDLDQPGHRSEDHRVISDDGRNDGRWDYFGRNARNFCVCHQQEPMHTKDESRGCQEQGRDNGPCDRTRGILHGWGISPEIFAI